MLQSRIYYLLERRVIIEAQLIVTYSVLMAYKRLGPAKQFMMLLHKQCLFVCLLGNLFSSSCTSVEMLLVFPLLCISPYLVLLLLLIADEDSLVAAIWYIYSRFMSVQINRGIQDLRRTSSLKTRQPP